MFQPIPATGESAAKYLRGNIAVGVSLEDSRIKVSGNLPPPNSAVSRSRITPFSENNPERGGYHIELNLTREELAKLALTGGEEIGARALNALGAFLGTILERPDKRDFLHRGIGALLRDAEIRVHQFPGSVLRDKGALGAVPYFCFEFAIGNFDPDPQDRTSALAHGIRRLNKIFDLVSSEGLKSFFEREKFREELARQWSVALLPQDEFESLQSKLKNVLGFQFNAEALTPDGKPRIVEASGEAHLRISFEDRVSLNEISEVLGNLNFQLAHLNGFIAEQMGEGRTAYLGFVEVEIVEEVEGTPYLYFTFSTPRADGYELDMEQALWLTESLFDDFIEVLRPYEHLFVAHYL